MTAAGTWICCQLGAREHYAVPRALHRAGRLQRLLTDAWAAPELRHFLGRLGQRYHPDLATARVTSFTRSLIGHELLWRLQRRRGWDHFMARNRWFESSAAASLRSLHEPESTTVFAHSYAAAGVFRAAKERGWTTVLGQIDPGPEHYALQSRLVALRTEYASHVESPPSGYFARWRIECELADWILVNSKWSRELVVRAGANATKIKVVPLPYEREAGSAVFERAYPEAFSSSRPLRALFVGTASVTKGVPELLQAVELLEDNRVELRLVGDCAMAIPARFAAHPRIKWVGPVDRGTVMEYYRSSDVLMFPSHSDGFGMAQVEAQGWALPIVASRHCGEVVQHGHTGMLLDEVSPVAVAAALRSVVESPELLTRFSQNAGRFQATGLSVLAQTLAAVEPA